MPLYRTLLYELHPDKAPTPPFRAKGWVGSLRHSESTFHYDHIDAGMPRQNGKAKFIAQSHHQPDGSVRNIYAPEVIIEAKSRQAAQCANNLIVAALSLLDGELSDLEAQQVVPDNPSLSNDLILPDDEDVFPVSTGREYVAVAVKVAAKATYRRCWSRALAKYWLSLRICSVSRYAHHPMYGQKFTIQSDPIDHAMMAQAILTGYAVLEELGLEIRASKQRPSKINGRWNPLVLQDLEKRLQNAKIHPDTTLVWHIRNTPRRIERQYPPPPGPRASWAKYSIRDRTVRVVDAVHYASTLRSRVSAHRASSLTQSLTMTDVHNVQFLARRLLFGSLGLWESWVTKRLG